MNKLDNPDNLKRIIDRLPYSARLKWQDTLDQIIEREATVATIKDNMKFVTAKARAATNLIFGKVTRKGKTNVPLRTQRRAKDRKAGGFSTHGKLQYGLARKENRCPMCTLDHWLSCSEKFLKLSYEERRVFVLDQRLCANCLYPGHYVSS